MSRLLIGQTTVMDEGLDDRVVLVTPSVEYVDSFFEAMGEFRGEGLRFLIYFSVAVKRP